MARRYTLDIEGRTFTIDVEETDIDRFRVVVGEQTYEVRLSGDEDLPEAKITPALEPGRVPHPAAHATNATSPPPKAIAPVPVRRAAPPAGGSGNTLSAPMPGVVLEVMVETGDAVARGQPIAVLEAMKMQNTIRSPREGTIADVCVAAGQAVGHGDAIVRFADA
jgi:biotin carboxyl carrier protein